MANEYDKPKSASEELDQILLDFWKNRLKEEKQATGVVIKDKSPENKVNYDEKDCADKDEEEATPEPEQLFLPGMQELMRAMPNHIARSSLFAPVARGRKKVYTDKVLVSRSDAVIKFWGEQLDEAQADVWMQAMYEAMKQPLGEPVVINRAEFLRAIGRHTGNFEYKWLFRAMEALSFAMLVIEVKDKKGKQKLAIGRTKKHALHMINGFVHDEKTGTYTLHIDPRWSGLYLNRKFALIDWEKRLQFGKQQDLAKALQRLIATSSDLVQRYNFEWLKAKMEYSSPIRKFREALVAGCKELERLGIINQWSVEDSTRGKEQLVLWLSN